MSLARRCGPAGVSSRTVSNVVNGYARVTEHTRVRVQLAVEELGYRPNVLARNLAQGRSGQLAVVGLAASAGGVRISALRTGTGDRRDLLEGPRRVVVERVDRPREHGAVAVLAL